MREPEDCHDMPALRLEIDRLDRELVGMLAQRQRYIERAAIIKSDRGRVHDDARIADVIAKVLAEAGRIGLSPAIAEPVWRELVAHSVAHEFIAFDAKGMVMGGSESDVPCRNEEEPRGQPLK